MVNRIDSEVELMRDANEGFGRMRSKGVAKRSGCNERVQRGGTDATQGCSEVEWMRMKGLARN